MTRDLRQASRHFSLAAEAADSLGTRALASQLRACRHAATGDGANDASVLVKACA